LRKHSDQGQGTPSEHTAREVRGVEGRKEWPDSDISGSAALVDECEEIESESESANCSARRSTRAIVAVIMSSKVGPAGRGVEGSSIRVEGRGERVPEARAASVANEEGKDRSVVEGRGERVPEARAASVANEEGKDREVFARRPPRPSISLCGCVGIIVMSTKGPRRRFLSLEHLICL
jgi:hypothetical protein